jgi:VanZ family protein
MQPWLLLIGYAGLIFWQSGHALPDAGFSLPGFDKLLHVAAYGLMGWLACRAVAAAGIGRRRTVLYMAALTLTVAFGLSDEWHQSFVPGRSADAWDLLADAMGGLLGVLFYHWRQHLRRSAA